MPENLAEYARGVAADALVASRELATVAPEHKDAWLGRTAELLRTRSEELIAANRRDLDAAESFGLTAAAVDRLRLDENRIDGIATGVEQIALMSDPIGELIDGHTRPSGLRISRVRVPLGVVFFIYESRPNVTVDAAALCVKSGNAVILRGGKEALHSNTAFRTVIADALADVGLPREIVQLVETTDRAAVGEFLKLNDLIDVTIPRGGRSLIERVTSEATMPVIKHFDGNCHVYVDRDADPAMACEIVVNAKCQRPGVCNAAETLLVHADIAAAFIPPIAGELCERGVELRGCDRTREFVPEVQPATDEDYFTEYLDLILAVKVVDDLNTAIAHINHYGSHHTDAIVTSNLEASKQFTDGVDSAAVMVNASTRFNDGAEFGLGAEIGISTDKLHARGPCGLRELTSYKYVVHGAGHVRN